MRFLSITVGLLLLAASGAAAQFSRVDVPIGPRGTNITLQLFLFDSRSVALKVIDQGGLAKQAYRDLDHAMVAHKCIAGCNGGPFAPSGAPRGLIIADGKSSGARKIGDPLSEGVLYTDGSLLRIRSASSYFKNATATPPRQLLQSGPILIEDGKAAAGLSARKFAQRSFILTDGKFRWAIGYSPTTTLAQLAQALANPKTFADFKVATALSLDGGSSCALWVKRVHHPFYLKELDPVRTFIGLVKK